MAFLLIAWLRIPPTIRKTYGTNGHPWQTPCWMEKVNVDLPLIEIQAAAWLNSNRIMAMKREEEAYLFQG
jgi:hypothetical protein